MMDPTFILLMVLTFICAFTLICLLIWSIAVMKKIDGTKDMHKPFPDDKTEESDGIRKE